MAIKESFEVIILVDGKPAPDFPDQDSQDDPKERNSISRFIEVTSGSQFAFEIKIHPMHYWRDETALGFLIHIDGKFARGVACTKDDFSPLRMPGWSMIYDGTYAGRGADLKRVMFRFADLETRE